MKRANAAELLRIRNDAEREQWTEPEAKTWLLDFAELLRKCAATARRQSGRASDNAACRIAWSLGQLVCPPDFFDNPTTEGPDNQRLVHLVIRLLDAYGIRQLMPNAFEAMAVSDKPLFVDEAWPKWRSWANDNLFAIAA